MRNWARAWKVTGFRSGLAMALLCLSGAWIHAQAPAAPKPAAPDQKQGQNKPAQQPGSGSQANPFPEDTNNVPVMPSGSQPAAAEAPAAEGPPPALPSGDVDPVRSPDEPVPDTSSSSSGSSSSSADLANIVVPPPDDEKAKSRNGNDLSHPEHQETAKEDENVGSLYLDQKNWKAALSRYQSALILDPDNPDVYWGLAESQRHLGDIANAKANYMKLVEYDPDSKHAREARKLLKEPEMAKAPASPAHP